MSGTIVVKLGGDIAVDPAKSVVEAIVCLGARRRVVVVHGGGTLLDSTLAALGHSVEKIEGLRVTPGDQIGTVSGVLAGSVNAGLVAAVCGAGGSAVGLTLGDGRLGDVVRVGPHPEPRLGCVGTPAEPEAGDGGLLVSLLDGGWMPIVACVGSHDGRVLNVNADDAAAGVARVVGASGVLLLTDVAGVLDADGSVIGDLDGAGSEALIDSGVIRGGMVPKVRAAARVATVSGCPVVIGRAVDLESLVEHAPGRGTVFRPSGHAATR